MSKAKDHCARYDCNPVVTGFTTNIYSCKTCKEELTEHCYTVEKKRIANNIKKEKEEKTKNRDHDNVDDYDYLGMNWWNNAPNLDDYTD